MIEELTEGYIPANIFFRDEQIGRIKKTAENFKKFGSAQNLILQGYTGTGKTAVIEFIKKTINPKDYLFAIGSVNQTSHQLLKSMFNMSYSTIGKVITEAILSLKENPKILIFDEINRLKDKQEIKSLFDALNTIYRETECPSMILTNLLDLNQFMADDARLTLNFGIINFPTYSVEQLIKIFEERIFLIEKNHDIKINIIDLERICNIVGENGEGSARQVRTILKNCLIEDNWSEEFIFKIIEGTLDEYLYLKIKNMPEREKKFFFVLYELHKKKEDVGGYFGINYNEIESLTGLSLSRISYFIDIFEREYGLINTKYDNQGRNGGNKRTIFFNYTFLQKIQKAGIIIIPSSFELQKKITS